MFVNSLVKIQSSLGGVCDVIKSGCIDKQLISLNR